MAKRPDTKETVLLALELMRRIPKSGTITTRELHDQLADTPLARDMRTIQRQLEMLIAHFDIECDDSSKPYGYRWKKSAQGMGLPMLTEQDSLLLALAEQHLHQLLPASMSKYLESFFAQARRNLDPIRAHDPLHANKGKREREWLKKVRVVSMTQPLLPPKIKLGIFEQVSNALYGNLWLNVDYENAAGKCTHAEVMPLGLAQQGPRFYLVCRYKDFDNERSLALHRIINAQASTLTFERPKNFDLEQYDNDGRFGFGNGKRIKLTLHISQAAGFHLIESPLSTDQQVRTLKDGYEITAAVVDTSMLDWWLRGFGDALYSVKKAQISVPFAESKS